MEVKQVYEIANEATKQAIGESAVLEQDLSNVVDVGNKVLQANALDHYVKALVNKIGKTVFVDRPYTSKAPRVLRDGWEYGSILEKIRGDMPDAEINPAWELQDGASYDDNVFSAPSVEAKFFNKKQTFDIHRSIAEKQVTESFTSRESLNRFVSMIYDLVNNSMVVKTDSLVYLTICSMIADTLHDDIPDANYAASSGVKAVNLLKLYNDATGAGKTVANCLFDKDFLAFASMTISNYIDDLQNMSVLFNVGKTEKHTPAELLHVDLLGVFERACDTYLSANTFHDRLVALPRHEIVTDWQGTGTSLSFADKSRVNVKSGSGNAVNATGIIGVLFDHDALGVCNEDLRIRSHYVNNGEFLNNWWKWDASHFADLNENFVVFFVA